METHEGELQLLYWTTLLSPDESASPKNKRRRPIELPALPSTLGPCPAVREIATRKPVREPETTDA